MDPANSHTTSLVDAGDGYFFERLHVEHSMLQSLRSGLKVSSANFDQVNHAYASILGMEKNCRDQLEKFNSSASDAVSKMAAIDLCEDMLHAADREVAVVKMVMARTHTLIEEAQACLAQYGQSRSSFVPIETQAEDARVTDALASTDKTAYDLRQELSAVCATYEELMNKWSQRVSVRNDLFRDIAIARKMAKGESKSVNVDTVADL